MGVTTIDWAGVQDTIWRALSLIEKAEGVAGVTLRRLHEESAPDVPYTPFTRTAEGVRRLEVAGRVERTGNGKIRLARCTAAVQNSNGGYECGQPLPCKEHGQCHHYFHRNVHAAKAGACPSCGAGEQ